MNELLIAYGLTIVFVCVLFAIWSLYRYLIANKYLQAEHKLRMKLNEATSYFKGNTDKAPDFIGKSIGNLGIEGILNELGLPKIVTSAATPVIQGFLSNPDNIKKIMPLLEKIGIKIPIGGKGEQEGEGVELL